MHRYLCFVLLLVAFPFATPQATETTGPCKCGVFPVVAMSKSIIERSLQLNVTCDNEGEGKCLTLCVALGESAKEKAPHMICDKLSMHVENMRVAVYAKICDATAWKFTGMMSDGPLCCHDGKSVPCRDPSPMIVEP